MSYPAEATQLQFWQFNVEANRLTFTTDEGIQPRVHLLPNPTRIVIDLPETTLGNVGRSQVVGDRIVEVRVAQFDPQTTRMVIELSPGYTLDPQQIQVRGIAPTQWLVQLPPAQAIASAETPPDPSPPPTAEEAIALEADTQLEEVRLTPDGLFLRTRGDRPNLDQDWREEERQLTVTLDETALSPQLMQPIIPVNRYGIEQIQLRQADLDPPTVQVILTLTETSPLWQATVSDLGGVVMVPVGGVAASPPENRVSQSLTPRAPAPIAPAPLPLPIEPPSPPTGLEPWPDVSGSQVLVVIDPGHGGRDPGAVGIDGLRETDIVLPVSLRLAELLQQHGVQVVLTRADTSGLELETRVQIANRANADLFISVHANAISMTRPDVNGVETYYYSASGLPLAQAIQAHLLQATGMNDRGVKRARFYVIRTTRMPAALVEVGFVTGAEDAPRLADPAFRDVLAEAIARGILQYIQQTLIGSSQNRQAGN